MTDLWQHIVADFSNIGSPAALSAFGQVVLIDIMLAADNAIVVGALAAGLPAAMRRKVIMIGVIAALVLRVAFALVVSQLMQIVGLVFAGGLLLRRREPAKPGPLPVLAWFRAPPVWA